MDKYKAGDKVRILRNTCYHSYLNGEIHIIHHKTEGQDHGLLEIRYHFYPEQFARCYVLDKDIERVCSGVSKNITVL